MIGVAGLVIGVIVGVCLCDLVTTLVASVTICLKNLDNLFFNCLESLFLLSGEKGDSSPSSLEAALELR